MKLMNIGMFSWATFALGFAMSQAIGSKEVLVK